MEPFFRVLHCLVMENHVQTKRLPSIGNIINKITNLYKAVEHILSLSIKDDILVRPHDHTFSFTKVYHDKQRYSEHYDIN